MRLRLCVLVVLLVIAGCAGRKPVEPVNVLASTSWTAAYATSAGAEKVELLAPETMLHPSEYELKMVDVKRLMNARFIVYGGYELMVDQMVKSLAGKEAVLSQIETVYRYEVIEKEVIGLSRLFGTEQIAQENLEKIKKVFDNGRLQLKLAKLDQKPVIVHFFQQAFAREMGMNIVGVFGPQQPEAYEVKRLLADSPELILDNFHNPVGVVVEKSAGIARIELLNFPGPGQTIEDVIESNVNALLIGK